MDRKIYQKLLVWKEKNSKMPYMLVGARQTGKTYILTNFCKNEFKNYLYLNLDGTAVGQRNALAVAVIVEGIRNVHIQPGLGGKHDGGTPDLFVGFIVGPEIFAGEVIIGVPALHGFPDRARPLQHGVLVVDVGRLDGEIISGGNGAVVVFKQVRVDENVSARKHLGGRRILQDVVFIDVDVIPQLPSVATVTEQRLVAFIPFVV